MKKVFALCSLLLLPAHIATAEMATAGSLVWSAAASWKSDVKPVDFAQSLDGRLVFILAEDGQVHLYSATEGRKLGTIPADKGTVAISTAPYGEMLYLVDNSGTYKAIDISFTKSIDISGSPFLGKESAPVAVVVFSDFQCPYCSRVKPLLDEVLKKNPETVKIVFKHFPLSMHEEAEPAARAAIAAQVQDKFWPMHDALFTVASSGVLNSASIEKAATDLGLDMAKFKADMNSEATKQKLAKDMDAARMAEVGGTPSLFVNGRKVNAPAPDAIQKMIEQELAKKK